MSQIIRRFCDLNIYLIHRLQVAIFTIEYAANGAFINGRVSFLTRPGAPKYGNPPLIEGGTLTNGRISCSTAVTQKKRPSKVGIIAT